MEISCLSSPAETGFRAGQRFVTVSLKARGSLDINYVDSHKLCGVTRLSPFTGLLLLLFRRLRALAQGKAAVTISVSQLSIRALMSSTEHMAAKQPGRSRENPATSPPIGTSDAVSRMETAMEVSTFEVLKELLPTGASKPADVKCRHTWVGVVRLRIFCFHDLRLS
jgi:hypothetical protein